MYERRAGQVPRDAHFDSPGGVLLVTHRTVMPDVLTATLKQSYELLPSGKMRWRCSEGQQFLHLLADTANVYGVAQCAVAIGRTPAGTHYMLTQRDKSLGWGDSLPAAVDLRPLVAAHDAVRARRASGRQVRRSTREYRDLHLVLTRLLTEGWELEMIAATAKINARDLGRFLAPPTTQMLAAMALEDLVDSWKVLTGEPTGPSGMRGRNTRFLKSLGESADLGNSRAKMAHALGLPPERITAMLLHGSAALRRKAR